MPIIQIDWERIKGKLDDVTAFYALTHRQASLLSSLAEQLTWKKTFQVNDYDWSDKDTLDAEIADLESNLQMPVNISDIIGYIDEIEDLLRALEQHAGCCDAGDISDGANFTDPVTDGEGDVPQNIIDAGYAEDAEDWEGFADYKCMVAHVSVDQLEARTCEIATHMDQDSTTYAIIGGIAVLTGIITHIFTAGLSTLTIAILTALGATSLLYKYLLDFELMEDLADDVATNHDELACAFYNSDGVDQAISNLKAKISELFSGPQALVLLNLNITPTVKALYAGRYDQADIAAQLAAAGYDTADFDCTCDEVGEYTLVYDFAESSFNWAGTFTYTGTLLRIDYNSGNIYHSVNTLRHNAGLDGELAGGWVDIHRIKLGFWSSAPAAGGLILKMNYGIDYEELFANAAEFREEEVFFNPPLHYVYNASYIIHLQGSGWTSGYHLIDDIEIEFDANTE